MKPSALQTKHVAIMTRLHSSTIAPSTFSFSSVVLVVLPSAVGSFVGDSAGEAVGEPVGDTVGSDVGSVVGDDVGDAVGEAVADVGDAVGDTVDAHTVFQQHLNKNGLS